MSTPPPDGSSASPWSSPPPESWPPPAGTPGFPAAPATATLHPRRGRFRWLIVGLAATLVVALGGGAGYAYSALRGGGSQPAAALPGTAVGYVAIDMDPSAGQKLAALRFLQKFPAVRDQIGSATDLRNALLTLLIGSHRLHGIDLQTDVDPWLGDRLGVAAVPTGSAAGSAHGTRGSAAAPSTTQVLAVQVTDQAKARAGLEKLARASGERAVGVAFVGDYAVVAASQGAADRYAAAAKSASLAKNSTFRSDIAAAGDPGVATFWADTTKLGGGSGAGPLPGLSGRALPGGTKLPSLGRVVGTLTFSGGTAELAGLTRGASLPTVPAATSTTLSHLPGSTAAALSVSGAGAMLQDVWSQLENTMSLAGQQGAMSQATQLLGSQLGLSLPGDLVTVLGRNVTLAVDGSSAGASQPQVGAVLTTDVPAARKVIDRLLTAGSLLGPSQPLAERDHGDTLVLATSTRYADQLLAGGDLGQQPGFRQAVPKADSAQVAGYVDVARAHGWLAAHGTSQAELADIAPLQAVGFSASLTGSDATFQLRLVAK